MQFLDRLRTLLIGVGAGLFISVLYLQSLPDADRSYSLLLKSSLASLLVGATITLILFWWSRKKSAAALAQTAP